MVIDAWYPVFGGAQVHSDYLCKHLIEDYGCSVDLFVRALKSENGKKFTKNESLHNGNLRIFRIGPCGKFFNPFLRIICLFTMTWVLYRNVKKNKYSLIHAHAYLGGIPAKIVGKLTGTPVIFTVHGCNNLDLNKKGLIPFVEKFVLTKIKYDKIISVSRNFLKYKRNASVIPNGVDIGKFDSVAVEKNKKFKIIFVGRLSWPKGLEILINAINKIDKELLADKEFHIIGDGELMDILVDKVKNYDLREFVKLRGKMSGDELIKEYKSSHLFVLPSLTEGQPLTLLEAFASRLPVIVTDVGDNKFFVKNDSGLLILLPGDVNSFAEAITKMLSIPKSELSKMGKFNYDLVKTNFTWQVMARNTYKEYLKFIR
jgi:glycosyltransferase involved in cell wall biosynthesis